MIWLKTIKNVDLATSTMFLYLLKKYQQMNYTYTFSLPRSLFQVVHDSNDEVTKEKDFFN
jgi:hypothetical protein